jgi:hypothetical protein
MLLFVKSFELMVDVVVFSSVVVDGTTLVGKNDLNKNRACDIMYHRFVTMYVFFLKNSRRMFNKNKIQYNTIKTIK